MNNDQDQPGTRLIERRKKGELTYDVHEVQGRDGAPRRFWTVNRQGPQGERERVAAGWLAEGQSGLKEPAGAARHPGRAEAPNVQLVTRRTRGEFMLDVYEARGRDGGARRAWSLTREAADGRRERVLGGRMTTARGSRRWKDIGWLEGRNPGFFRRLVGGARDLLARVDRGLERLEQPGGLKGSRDAWAVVRVTHTLPRGATVEVARVFRTRGQAEYAVRNKKHLAVYPHALPAGLVRRGDSLNVAERTSKDRNGRKLDQLINKTRAREMLEGPKVRGPEVARRQDQELSPREPGPATRVMATEPGAPTPAREQGEATKQAQEMGFRPASSRARESGAPPPLKERQEERKQSQEQGISQGQ